MELKTHNNIKNSENSANNKNVITLSQVANDWFIDLNVFVMVQ